MIVCIQERHPLPACFLYAAVPGCRDSTILLADQPDSWIAERQHSSRSLVAGAIVDNNDLKQLIAYLPEYRPQGVFDEVFLVIERHHH